MSEKLGQSLDEILAHKRGGSGRGGARNTRRAGRSTATPANGIQKSKKQVKSSARPVPRGPAKGKTPDRLLISKLPEDVQEGEVEEYLKQIKHRPKKVEMMHGRSGNTAEVTFYAQQDVLQTMAALKDVKLEGRKLGLAMVVDSSNTTVVEAAAPKKLSDRIVGVPKPKSAAPTKTTAAKGPRQAGKERGGKRGARGNRKPKTAEELDLEMADYWESGNTAAADGGASGAAQTAANGDATMDDEVL